MTMVNGNAVNMAIRAEKRRPVTWAILLWQAKGLLLLTWIIAGVILFMILAVIVFMGLPLWLGITVGLLLAGWFGIHNSRMELQKVAADFWDIFTGEYIINEMLTSADIGELGADPAAFFRQNAEELMKTLPATMTPTALQKLEVRVEAIAEAWDDLVAQEDAIYEECSGHAGVPDDWLKFTATAAQRTAMKKVFIAQVEGPKGWAEQLAQVHDKMMTNKLYEKALLDDLKEAAR